MTPMTLTDLQSHLSAGTKPLGALVYWSGLSDVRIPRSTFRAEMERIGLGEAVGRDPKAEACANMAASVAVRRQRKDLPGGKIQLKEKGQHAVFAVLMRRDVAVTSGDQRIRYLEEARVAIDRGQPSPTPVVITASDVDQDDARDALIADMVSEYSDILSNIRTQECSEALAASMQLLGGLSLRTGVYFVPASQMPQLLELRAFIEAHTQVHLTTWTIAATDANAAQSRRDARAAFLDQVSDLIAECKSFAEAKGDELGTKSINARIKRFHELEGKTALYADILGDYVEDLRTTISAAKEAFTNAVLGEE
jgi:hypothetical protein